MARWICKSTGKQGQKRFTIPKGLVDKMGWTAADIFELRETGEGRVELSELKVNPDGETSHEKDQT